MAIQKMTHATNPSIPEGWGIWLEEDSNVAFHRGKYSFMIDDYDGAPDSGNSHLHGAGNSVEDCITKINDAILNEGGC